MKGEIFEKLIADNLSFEELESYIIAQEKQNKSIFNEVSKKVAIEFLNDKIDLLTATACINEINSIWMSKINLGRDIQLDTLHITVESIFDKGEILYYSDEEDLSYVTKKTKFDLLKVKDIL